MQICAVSTFKQLKQIFVTCKWFQAYAPLYWTAIIKCDCQGLVICYDYIYVSSICGTVD